VIGLGGLVNEQIAPAIVESSHSVLVGCVGSTPDKSRAFAQKFGVEQCYTSIEELAAADVEAIFIATPNADHHAMVLAAARAGKHILCEKPLALSAQDGREMVAACNAAGVIFRVAFQIRLEEALIRVRDIIASGALGELRSVLFERTAPLRQRGAWRNDARQGGVLFDVAVHLLDQVEWLSGLRMTEVSDRILHIPAILGHDASRLDDGAGSRNPSERSRAGSASTPAFARSAGSFVLVVVTMIVGTSRAVRARALIELSLA